MAPRGLPVMVLCVYALEAVCIINVLTPNDVIVRFSFDVQENEKEVCSLLCLPLSSFCGLAFFVLVVIVLIAKIQLAEARMEIIRCRVKAHDRGL